MRRSVHLLSALVLAAVLAWATNPAMQEKQTGKTTPKQQPKSASLTGCVDQQDGHYVLIDDHDRKPIADLEAEGFPTEGFAKHVGHKVTVRGTSSEGSTKPLFKVRTIQTVSEECAPQRP